MALSAMELKLGVFGVLPTRHAKTNAKPMRPRSSCTVRHFTRVLTSRSDRSRCSDITSDEPPWFWLRENPKTPIWAPIKMVQVQGSPVYIYGYTLLFLVNVKLTFHLAVQQPLGSLVLVDPDFLPLLLAFHTLPQHTSPSLRAQVHRTQDPKTNKNRAYFIKLLGHVSLTWCTKALSLYTAAT